MGHSQVQEEREQEREIDREGGRERYRVKMGEVVPCGSTPELEGREQGREGSTKPWCEGEVAAETAEVKVFFLFLKGNKESEIPSEKKK